jgi:hypothetical protein
VRRPVADHEWRGKWSLPGDYVQSFLIEPDGTIRGVPNYLEARNESLFPRGLGSNLTSVRLPESPTPVLRWEGLANHNIQSYPSGIVWPGSGHRIGGLDVLIPVPEITSLDDLRKQQQENSRRGGRGLGRLFRVQNLFFARYLDTTDWPHRIDAGTADKPGTLWITPTDEAAEKIRAAIAEIQKTREAVEQANAEIEKRRAEQLKARTEPPESEANSGPNPEKAAKKDEPDSK